MIFFFLAGFLNALGTFTLKLSNKNIIFLFGSIFFYGSNFFLFRIGLKSINSVSIAYSVLTVTSLISLLFIDFLSNNLQINPSIIFSSLIMIFSLYVFFKNAT